MTQPLAKPSAIKIWWAAVRPKTLWAAVAPVMVGSAIAAFEGSFIASVASAAVGGAIGIQMGTNLFNDWADNKRGADSSERLGPARASAQGWLCSREILWGCAIAYAFATLCGVYLLTFGGWVLACIGICSLLSGLAYTGGPYPLAYTGLADIFVLVFFGPVATLSTAWLQGSQPTALAVCLSMALGMLTLAILVVNNLRDRHTDGRVGKKTLAVRFGARFARVEYSLAVFLPFLLAPCALYAAGRGIWAFGPVLLLPLALGRVRAVWHSDGRALNALLAETAQLTLGFAAAVTGSLLF